LVAALDRLEDVMPVPIWDAYVSRVDLGVTLPVSRLPGVYLARFGSLHRYQQDNYGETVRYRQCNRQVVLYDKGAETGNGRAGETLPVEYGGGYGLRVEIRYMGAMAKQFGGPVTFERLRGKGMYLDGLSRVERTFQAIHKATREGVSVKSRQDARLDLLRTGLKGKGGAVRYLKEIRANYETGLLSAIQYHRIKKDIEKIEQGAGRYDAVLSELEESGRVEFSRLRESAAG
jgi:hypothetical protein